MKKRTKNEALKSAAILKIRYTLTTGKLDDGFRQIYQGVLEDLGLTDPEVEAYIQENRASLKALCMETPSSSSE